MRTHVNSTGLLLVGDPALSFHYPGHIARASLDALPAQPGIYIFRDEEDKPLYVGKSVNIRSRVLSHLRTPAETQMLTRARTVDFECTGGEIGALLREAQLIKQWQPVFNHQLRSLRAMCALRLEAGLPLVVSTRDCDFARSDGLYGLFGSRASALATLRELVDDHGLCAAIVGLERVSRGRACFAHQIGRCRGVCIGRESAADHAARLQAALEPLRVLRWPYAGAIAIVEQSHGLCQRHLVDHWHYLGPQARGRRARPQQGRFDIDVYQILAGPLLDGSLTVEPL